MSENSKIEWTDHTFNPWTGCTKVSPGCAHCYAEGWAKRSGIVEWGRGKPRRRTSEANWREPIKWNRAAEGGSQRPRVFCASLADWLDDEVPIEWLADLLKLIFATQNLDWLLLTKRPENFVPRLERVVEEIHGDLDLVTRVYEWLGEKGDRFMKPVAQVPPGNVWVGTTVENQEMAETRVPVLLGIPAVVRFLSCEPLLEAVDIRQFMWPVCAGWRGKYATAREAITDGAGVTYQRQALLGAHVPLIKWVICGGESGPGARAMDLTWAEALATQCRNAGTAFFMKQMGGIRKPFPEIPDHLMIREFPKVEVSQ